jgi:hypothetical protein
MARKSQSAKALPWIHFFGKSCFTVSSASKMAPGTARLPALRGFADVDFTRKTFILDHLFVRELDHSSGSAD